MELIIAIKHRLDNRLRINFSKSIKNFEKLKAQVMEHNGIETFEYNPVTQNLLIYFDNQIIRAQELLIRTAVAYSLENSLSPVKIFQIQKEEFITKKGLLSGLFILTAMALSAIPRNEMLKKSVNWISAATTAAAVLEHAVFDYKKKGSVDPEVLSLGLMVNSIVNNKKILIPSALTWISTFGRHFSSYDSEGIILDVTKKREDSKKAYYHLNISKLKNKGNLADLLYVLSENFFSTERGFNNSIFEGVKDLMHSHDEFIEGMGEKNDGMVLHFNQ